MIKFLKNYWNNKFNFETKWDLIKKQIWCRWFHKEYMCFSEVWDRGLKGPWHCNKCHPCCLELYNLSTNTYRQPRCCPIAGCIKKDLHTVQYGYYDRTIHTISLCDDHIMKLWEKCKGPVTLQLTHWEHKNANN